METRRRTAGDILWGVGAAILLNAVMILLAVSWVAFYSMVLDPGRGTSFYEAYAGRASPIVSVVAGGPVFYLIARWVTRWRSNALPAWVATFLYLLSDLLLLAVTGALLGPVGIAFAGGGILKVAGTALGVKQASR
jgi:hypothetical protein